MPENADEEYAAALTSEWQGLQEKLSTLRHERDQGKQTVRQLRTEQIFLQRQKEQREKYRDLCQQQDVLVQQLEEKKRQKKKALQQLVREKSGHSKEEQQDVSEITFQCGVDDTDIDVEEFMKEIDK
jgi:chromosome segregation ATPase